MGTILSFFPILEVFLRAIYWLFKPFFVSTKNSTKLNFRHDKILNTDLNKFFENLESIGIVEGEIILIHTSSEVLNFLNISPNTFIQKLYNLVGANGAILVNTSCSYSYYSDSVFKKYRFFDDVVNYSPIRSMTSTGLIPYVLLRRNDAVRSIYPVNSICGIGVKAAELLDGEKIIEYSTFSDVNSVWFQLYKRSAKVFCFGMKFEDCCTIMHVAEDIKCLNGENYFKWYYIRKFNIVFQDKIDAVYIRHIKPIYGKIFYTRFKFRRDMLSSGIVKIFNNEGFLVEYYNSHEFINAILKNNNSKYPYYKN